jgi:hypothetical protein
MQTQIQLYIVGITQSHGIEGKEADGFAVKYTFVYLNI